MTISPKYEFDAEDADVILVTADSIDGTTEFHLHKCILASASPFFEDMFSLPQEIEESKSSPMAIPKKQFLTTPIIPICEPARIFDTILRFAHPNIPNPCVSSLDELTILFGVAVKYDFIEVIDTLRTLLVSPPFLTLDPIHVYAIACRFDLEEEVKIASGWTLGVNLLGDDDDEAYYSEYDSGFESDTNGGSKFLPHPSLRYISAYDYHRLLTLHRRRTKGAFALLKIADDIKCMHCNGSVLTMHAPPRWWEVWTASAKAELVMRPKGDRIFSVDYVFGAAKRAGCVGCVESVVHSWEWLSRLKEAFNKLPRTV